MYSSKSLLTSTGESVPMSVFVLIVLAAGLVSASDGPPESISKLVISVRDSSDGQAVRELEYCRKAGELTKESFWDTMIQKGANSKSFDRTPPSNWQRCDTTGVVELDRVQMDEVVFMRAPGYETKAVQIRSGSGPNIEIDLTPVEAISGIVVGSDDKGISDVPILIGSLPPDFYRWDLRELASAIADKDGQFRLDSYPNKFPLLLTACTERFGAGYLIIHKTDDVRNCRILLRNAFEFVGNIHLSKGTARQVTVMAELLTPEGVSYGRLFSGPSEGDSFSIVGMPTGEAQLYVSGRISYLLLLEKEFNHEQRVDIKDGSSPVVDIYINN